MAITATTTLRKICAMKKRIRAVAGGQGSSKTYSILMVIINHCSGTPDRKAMIVSQELAKMRTNVISDFIKIMKEFGIFDEKRWNSSECIYRFENGSTIQFYGSNKPDAGKGTRNSVVFFNEANKISFDAYRELSTRADNIFLDWNRNVHCWVDEYVIPRDDCEFLVVNYKDNEALGEQEKSEILHYKEMAYNEDGSVKSEYWLNVWRIYGLGECGKFVGTIFTNVRTDIPFDDTLPFVYAYDCGYNDEDGLVKVAVDTNRRIIYVKEELYQAGLSNADVTKIIKDKVGDSVVVCDSAAAKTVADLKQAGIRAVSCQKRKIVDDIKDIQGYTIATSIYDVNFIKELNNWRWKDVDGKSIPEDGDLHCFPAYTPIITSNGYKPIANVGKGDFVLASDNKYHKVLNNFYNGKRITYICKVTTNLGCFLFESTPDHKININGQWTEIQQLKAGDRILMSQSQSTDLSSGSIKVKDITARESQEKQNERTYTYGKNITDQFHRATIYTTKTITRLITKLKTLNFLNHQSTSDSICRKGCRTLNILKNLKGKWITRGYSRRSGINQTKVGNFIEKLAHLQVKNGLKNRLNALVTDAERNSFKVTQENISVQQNAQTPIEPQKEGQEETITSQGYVNTAGKSSLQTNMQKTVSVQEAVVLNIDILFSRTQDVYDIEVEDVNNYFAWGVNVHNCVDPMRYGYNYLTSTKPEKPTMHYRGNFRSHRYQA